MVTNFSKLMRKIRPQILEVQRTLSRINSTNFTPGISLSNCKKTKTDKNLEKKPEKIKNFTYKEMRIQ